MVLIASTLLFVTGSAVLDAIESGAEDEQSQLFIDETNHNLLTVASTGHAQELPISDMSTDRFVVDSNAGEINVTWHGGDENRSANGPLGALEFEFADRTVAHQGGGIWEDTGDTVLVNSEPPIEYDGERLSLTVLQIDEDTTELSNPVARANHTAATDLNDRISEAADESDGENVSIEIESEYYEGWETYLEDEIGGHENATVDSNGDTVTVDITGARDPGDPSLFVIEDENGFVDDDGGSIDHVIHENQTDEIGVNSTIRNEGDEHATQEVKLIIEGETKTKTEISLYPDDPTYTGDVLNFAPDDLSELTPGETYEYTIETDDDDSDAGTFYFGHEGSNLDVINPSSGEITPDIVDGNATIELAVKNTGIKDTSADLELEFGDLDANSTQSIDVDYGSETTADWTVNKTSLPAGSNEFTVSLGDESVASGTVTGIASDGDGMFVVVEDEGAGSDQIVKDNGELFEVRGGIQSAYPHDNVTRDVTLTIPDAGVEEYNESITLNEGEHEMITFEVDPDEYEFELGTVYEYDMQAEGDGLSENGTFYFGSSGTDLRLSNADTTVDDDVTITADLHNVGVDNAIESPVYVDLEYTEEDGLPEELDEDPYEDPINAGPVEQPLGTNSSIELPINQSKLLDGNYTATISTQYDEVETEFTVSAGVDPGRVGLGEIDNATVDISVLGSQVSGTDFLDRDHSLGTMTLDVLTEQNGQTQTEHVFENPEGGNNINTYPAWQNKDHYVYNTTIEIEEESTLTLASRSYGLPQSTAGCELETASRGRGDHRWCTQFDDSSTDYLVDPVDATTDEQEQNLRVRSAENNDVPSLQPGNSEQESVDEILADISDPAINRDSLWENGELNLEDNEFIFLFETTTQCGMSDAGCSEDDENIDALWESAQQTSGAGDPNFNDLIVYVRVNRADVNPGTPSIDIIPHSNGEESTVGIGEGGDAACRTKSNSDSRTETQSKARVPHLKPVKEGRTNTTAVLSTLASNSKTTIL